MAEIAASGRVLVDFRTAEDFAAWRAVDDVVMGGRSHSGLEQAGPGIARFCGSVSLEHGGGFASVRTEPRAWPTAGTSTLLLQVRGDGHAYKFTVRVDDGYDGIQYQARFAPARDAWELVRLPFADFVPTFRGRRLAGVGPLDPGRIRRLGLMISDRQAGPFELLIRRLAVDGA